MTCPQTNNLIQWPNTLHHTGGLLGQLLLDNPDWYGIPLLEDWTSTLLPRMTMMVWASVQTYLYIHDLGSTVPPTGADPGFLKGGGGPGADTPPLGHCPRDVIRPPKNWKTPPLLDIHKHPPLDIARVTSTTFQGGGGWSVPVTHTLHRFSVSGQVRGGGGGVITPATQPPGSATGVHLTSTSKKEGGSNFGPNVKKPTSWPKRGGPDPLAPPPPPGSATALELRVNQVDLLLVTSRIVESYWDFRFGVSVSMYSCKNNIPSDDRTSW